MEMNWFDIFAAVLILLVGIKGIFNGLIKELAGLIGIVAGVWIASLFAAPFGEWFGRHIFAIESASALTMIGFLVLLAGIWLCCVLLGAITAKLLALSGLGIVDRVFGFVFASAKVFVIISVIVFSLSNIDIVRKNIQKFTARSLTYPIFIKAGGWIMHLGTDDLNRKSKAIKREGKKTLDSGVESIEMVKKKIGREKQ
ncbi:CvpA family protein [Hydrogenimonas sp.]